MFSAVCLLKSGGGGACEWLEASIVFSPPLCGDGAEWLRALLCLLARARVVGGVPALFWCGGGRELLFPFGARRRRVIGQGRAGCSLGVGCARAVCVYFCGRLCLNAPLPVQTPGDRHDSCPFPDSCPPFPSYSPPFPGCAPRGDRQDRAKTQQAEPGAGGGGGGCCGMSRPWEAV